MKTISLILFGVILTVSLFIQSAVAVKVPKSNPFPIYKMEDPEFAKLYVKRLKAGTGSPEQQSLDILTIIAAIDTLGYTHEQLGTSLQELGLQLRKTVILYLKKQIKGIDQGALNDLDVKISKGEIHDAIRMYSLQAEELEISEERFKSLQAR